MNVTNQGGKERRGRRKLWSVERERERERERLNAKFNLCIKHEQFGGGGKRDAYY